MADQFPTSQNPRRSMSPLRFAQQLTPTLNPMADISPVLQAPQAMTTPSLRTSSPMRQDATLGVDGLGTSSPMGGGRGGPQFTSQFTQPMHPSSPTPAPDADAGAGRGFVNPPLASPSAPMPSPSSTSDIQFDKATNTFSNAAGRAMPLFSSPGAGGAGGTPGHPTAATDATMQNLANSQTGAAAHALQMNDVASGAGVAGNLTSVNPRTIGLRNGGTVPGTGQGDKIPAMLEPKEIVVSNAMLEEDPSLRGKLTALRTKVLAEKGETDGDADDRALRNGAVHAADGYMGNIWNTMKNAVGASAAPAGAAPGSALVPVPGTGDNGYRPNFTVGDAPTPGATAEPTPINPRGMGAKLSDLGDLTARTVKSMPNPGQMGAAVGNAATDAGAALGKFAKANVGKAANVLTSLPTAAAFADPNLTIGDKVKLGVTDALRTGGTALGAAFGGGVTGLGSGGLMAIPGALAGGYAGDQGGQWLADKLTGITGENTSDMLRRNNYNPDRNIGELMTDGKGFSGKGTLQQGKILPAETATAPAADPSLRGPVQGQATAQPASQPTASRLPGMVNPSDADVAQHARDVASMAAMGDRMEADRLRNENPDPRSMLMAQVQRSINENGGMTKGSSAALQSLAGNDVNLEGHRMTLRNSQISKQIATERLREEMRQHSITNDRAEREFGYKQGQDQFSNNQAATKAYTEQLGSKYQTTDHDGKPIVDAQKVAEHVSGAQEYINDAAKNLRAQGNEAGAAQVLKQGFAGLDDKHKSIIDQGMAMKNLVRDNKGLLPGSSTFVDSNNPADYSIVGKDGSSYHLKNGAQVPRYLVDGGYTLRHPISSIGAPQSNTFTSIGQQAY